MSILLDCAHLVHLSCSTFGAGLAPSPSPALQPDNLTPRHPADSASLAEQTAHSIAATMAEETASFYGNLVEADRSAELARLAVADGWFAPVLAAF